MATTDKVYDINNKKNSFVETDVLGGNDPYSASKASLEILIKKYLHSEKSNKKFGIFVVELEML